MANAGLALGLVLLLQLRPRQLRPRQLRPRHRQRGDLSLRGATFATLMLMISLPGILMLLAMGRQLTEQAMGQFQRGLDQEMQGIAWLLPAGSGDAVLPSQLRRRFAGMAVDAVTRDGRHLRLHPELFARVEREFRQSPVPLPASAPGLTLWVRRDEPSVLEQLRNGYWRYQVIASPASSASPWLEFTLLQPSGAQIQRMTALMRPPLQILAALLIGAALVSEALTTLLTAQFQRILGPLSRSGPEMGAPDGQGAVSMPRLPSTGIRELNRLVTVINRQGSLVNRLTERLQAANEQLRRSEQRHRLLADNALDVITLSDLDGRPSYISPSIEKVRGWTVAEAMALPMERQLRPEGCAYVRQALEASREAMRQGLPLPSFRVELEQSHSNGSWIWTDVTSSCIVDEAGQYVGTLIVYRDITQRKRLEEELQRLASVDALTQLLTRRALLNRLDALLAEGQRRRAPESLALLFCDLDRFKDVNDNLGHAAGDAVLLSVAERIRGSIRHQDLAGRMGGDELVVVLRSVSDLEAAQGVAEKIGSAIAQPIQGPGFRVSISASIGVTLARPGENVDALIARADIAMYQAKQTGRQRVVPIP